MLGIIDAVEMDVVVTLAGVAAEVGQDIPPFCIESQEHIAARGVFGAAFELDLSAVDVCAVFSHNVDDAEDRVGAIERGAGTANHFDALDGLHGNDEILIDVGLVVNILARGAAIDEDEDAGVPFTGAEKAADAGEPV